MSWVILRHKKLDKFKGKVNSKDLAIELYALEDNGLDLIVIKWIKKDISKELLNRKKK